MRHDPNGEDAVEADIDDSTPAWSRSPPGRFAVLDVETTGFNARGTDRIVEIAIVSMGPDGQVDDRFSSLVNPDRDIGPTHIHGITATDVVGAPRFGEIAGEVVRRLAGAVVVGHNVGFDERFVRAELARAGIELPAFPTLCTLRLASRLDLPSCTRSLEDCCSAVGVELRDAHSALEDAAAAGQLLLACLRLAQELGGASLAELCLATGVSEGAWPTVPSTGLPLPRQEARRVQATEAPFLARLVAVLPHDSTLSGDATAYLETLDRALADRVISDSEGQDLLDAAREGGLSAAEATKLHRNYLGTLCAAALEDGVLTELERRDLESVARLLGLGRDALEEELQRARPAEGQGLSPTAASVGVVGKLWREDLRGKSVCFTGELLATINGEPVTREHAIVLATAAGMAIATGVTKKLDYLVVADPNTMSGKAKKARQYGTVILAEPVFWSALGVRVG